MSGPWLAAEPRARLDQLNTDRTGCGETSGYCNAADVIANMLISYGNADITPFTWYFSLADMPGVGVENITNVAGRTDVEFSFPDPGGVTGILLDASTYRFAGYVKNGAQTLLLKQANVAGPGVRP